VGRKKKLSTGAIIWCWICLVLNFVVPTLLIQAYDMGGGGSEGLPLLIVGAVVGGLCAVGYIVLLVGKKVGFFILCGSAAVSAILSIVAMNIPQAALGFINPFITWLLIKGRWNTWDEIDREKATAKEAYQQQHKERHNVDSFFWEHGKKFKTWACINCICVPGIIFAILAIFESDKAQKAQSKEMHDRHIKKALILNICTYVVFFAVMGILQATGVLNS